jgi:amino acid adenylation domain-containing protein
MRSLSANQLLQMEARTPFNLNTAPLFRIALVAVDRDDYILMVNLHHLISDGWSTHIFFNELCILYSDYLAAKTPSLPELPVQYSDYITWQQKWQSTEMLAPHLEYWKNQLAGATPFVHFGSPSRQHTANRRSGRQQFHFDQQLLNVLKKFSRQENVTLFMALLGAFQVLLARYTSAADVVVASPVAGRPAAETEQMIGCFVNLIVLRSQLPRELTFTRFLKNVRNTCLDAYAHQDLPIDMLANELQPQRSPFRVPYAEIIFSLQPHLKRPSLAGLTMVFSEVETSETKFDLVVAASEEDDFLIVDIQYNAELYGGEQVKRMGEHYGNLLRGMVKGGGESIWGVVMMGEKERRQMVEVGKGREREWEERRGLVERIEEQARRRGGEQAVGEKGRKVSYVELNERGNQWGHYLRRLGVRAEERVGVCMERGVEMVMAELGIWKAGGAYVPLDREHPGERLGYEIEDSGARVVVVDESSRGRIPEVAGVRVICVEEVEGELELEGKENPGWRVEEENLAYVIYTSGSTGRPKGVEVEHGGLKNLVNWHVEAYGVGVGERASVVAGVGFDAAVWEVWPSLAVGGSLEIAGEEERVSGEKLREWLREERIGTSFLPTPLAESVMREGKGREGTGLKRLLTGGDRLQERPWAGYEAEVVNHYGPTENTVVATAGVVGRGERRPGIGRAISNVQVYVLDEEMATVPVGVVGEIYIGGAGVARGYCGKAEETGERFVPDGVSGGEGKRLYRSGDMGRWNEEGELEFMGRKDRQVKMRGHRIELGEVQGVLKEQAGVREAVVVVREVGRGNVQLVAYYAGEARAEELKKQLRERLPGYMVPERYQRVERLPVNRSGKVDEKQLPEVEEVVGEEEEGREGLVEGVAAVEEIVGGIWREVLGGEKRVGRGENFFELGGHSLLGTQVISRVKEVFGVEVELRKLFERGTVAGLAEEIEKERERRRGERAEGKGVGGEGEERGGGEGRRIEKRGWSEGAGPLSYAQQRLWFLEQLRPGTSLYHIPIAVRLRGELNREALERSIQEIVRRHEALRTSFGVEGGRPVQRIHPPAPLPLPLSDFSSAQGQCDLQELIRQEASLPFDLSRAPLLRLRLVRFSREEYLLILTMHHLISDGWSMGVFMREMAAIYPAMCRSEVPLLPELQFQYADYSLWQRRWIEEGALQNQLAYWRKQLAGPLPILELPTDHPRPLAQTFTGKQYRFKWDIDFLNHLRTFSSRNGVTLFMALMAGFQAVIHRYTGQTDVVVGTAVANRNRLQIENLIGFFLNLLPLRVRIDGALTFQGLLSRVRETTLDAYAYQDVPFEMLVAEAQAERDLSKTPLFQVLLVLQNVPIPPLELPGLKIENVDVDYNVSKFDLSLYFQEDSQGLAGWVEYNADLFNPERIVRMVSHLKSVLENMVQDPAQRISSTNLSTERESSPRCESLSDNNGDNQTWEPHLFPNTPTEVTVASIWQKVLGASDLPVHDKFFEIGGDSLRLVQVFLELNAIYPGKVTVADLFIYNTIASLAAFIDQSIDNRQAASSSLRVYEL